MTDTPRVWYEVQRKGRLGADVHGTLTAAYDAAQRVSRAFPDERVIVTSQVLTGKGLPARRGRRRVATFLNGEEQDA